MLLPLLYTKKEKERKKNHNVARPLFFPFPAYLLSSPSVVQAGLACCVSLLSSRSGFSHCDPLSTTSSLLFVREARHFTPQTATVYFFFATLDPFKYSSVTPPPSVRPRGRTSRSQHQYSPIPPLNRSSAEFLEFFLRNPFFLRGGA